MGRSEPQDPELRNASVALSEALLSSRWTTGRRPCNWREKPVWRGEKPLGKDDKMVV